MQLSGAFLLTMEKLKADDDRRHNFFIIDNEIIDSLLLCPVGIAMYSQIVRISNKSKLYFSVSKFCREFKVGKPKALKIFDQLYELDLFEITGKTSQGARRLQLKPVKNNTRFHIEPAEVSNKTGTGSKQNPNNTNKQDLTNNTIFSNNNKLRKQIIDKIHVDYYECIGEKFDFNNDIELGQIRNIVNKVNKTYKGDFTEFEKRWNNLVILHKKHGTEFYPLSPGTLYKHWNKFTKLTKSEADQVASDWANMKI
jgi:hypothetical protein